MSTYRLGWWQLKQCHRFFPDAANAQFAVFGCFAAGQSVDECFNLSRCNIYKDFSTSTWSRNATGLPSLCTASLNASLSSVYFCFLSTHLFASVASDRSTQRTEHTCCTQTAISFKVLVYHSQQIFAIVSIGEKSCRVFVSVKSIFSGAHQETHSLSRSCLSTFIIIKATSF